VTLATALKLNQDGELGLISGLYAIAPFIKGQWPAADCPSSTENNGIFIDVQTNRATVAYGIEAFTERNPLAWPSFATAADVDGFPPVVISVHECDPLRDEGFECAERLRAARVPVEHRHFGSQIHGFFTFVNLLDDADKAISEAGATIRAVAKG